jgi:peroxiredoxin
VFYPLAFSPVCAHQLPLVEKALAKLHALDADVLGISVDSHYANEAFARQLHLSFPLLSDWRREAASAYGLLNREKLYSGRAVVVVDRAGTIVYKDTSPVPGDVAQIPDLDLLLAALERLR